MELTPRAPYRELNIQMGSKYKNANSKANIDPRLLNFCVIVHCPKMKLSQRAQYRELNIYEGSKYQNVINEANTNHRPLKFFVITSKYVFWQKPRYYSPKMELPPGAPLTPEDVKPQILLSKRALSWSSLEGAPNIHSEQIL